MGLQEIEAGPKYGSPVFPVDQDTRDMAAAHRGVRHGVSFQRMGASIALSAADGLPESKTVESSRGKSRVVAGASVTVAACVLWLFIGAVADNALCGESDARERKQALEHEQEWDRAEALARALTSSLQGELDAARSAAEAERITQKQLIDQERGRAETLARELASLEAELDKARIVGLEAVQATEGEIKQKQALVQERDRADALARELGSLRAELNAARNAGPEVTQAAEAEIKQRQALEQAIKQERDRADNLARELASLRAERAAASIAGPEVAQAAEAEIKQKQALEQAIKQERDRADALAHQLTSVRSDLDMARAAALETTQTIEAAKIKQEQAFEKERDKTETLARELAAARKEADARSALLAAAHAEALQMTATNRAIAAEQKLALASERDRADALAHELTSVRSDLDMARAAALEAAQITKAAKVEQERALEKERDKTEMLARELAAARKEADARSARLAAAHAEVLQMTETNDASAAEQKLALASERDRADALAREFASARDELEAGKRQIAALTALGALPSREPAVDSSQQRRAESSSSTIEGNGPSPEQSSDKAVASISQRSFVSEVPRPEAPSAAHEAASHSVPKVAAGADRSTSASGTPSSLVDEQRLLARANALLARADISGARPLLQHAVERGSARAAFMLAETYDARVLQSWRTSGIAGDRTKARELYERARAGGIEDAKERIEALK
ncbi:MAG: hypothetical protein JWP25_4302 [Bradyrhizobium sp.]|nr:hypothetical protein [Bradyrhizobium sp.]